MKRKPTACKDDRPPITLLFWSLFLFYSFWSILYGAVSCWYDLVSGWLRLALASDMAIIMECIHSYWQYTPCVAVTARRCLVKEVFLDLDPHE